MALGAGNRAPSAVFSHRGSFPTPAAGHVRAVCACTSGIVRGNRVRPTSVRRPQVGEQARQLGREDIDEGRDPDTAQLQVSGTPSAAQPPGTTAPTAPSKGLAPHTKDGKPSRRGPGGTARHRTGASGQCAYRASWTKSQLRRAPSRRFRGSQIATLATPTRGDSSALVNTIHAASTPRFKRSSPATGSS